MRCGKSREEHMIVIDKVRKRLLCLSMMEKNLVTEYFETFQVLDGSFSVCLTINDVNVIMHSLGSLCVSFWPFVIIIGNQTSLTLPIFIRENLHVTRGNENKQGLEYSLAFFYISGQWKKQNWFKERSKHG
jgi:hypothetical protein